MLDVLAKDGIDLRLRPRTGGTKEVEHTLKRIEIACLGAGDTTRTSRQRLSGKSRKAGGAVP